MHFQNTGHPCLTFSIVMSGGQRGPARASLEIAHGVDGDREARAYPRSAQSSSERRAGTGPRGRSGIGAPRIGRGGFTCGYPIDDRRRVERIANVLPPLERNLAGARGPRQMRRYLIFCACAANSAAQCC
jgi:hypothetical protein